MIVRPATIADAAKITRVHVATWQAAYQDILSAEFLDSLSVEQWPANWGDRLKAGVPEVWVAEQQGDVVGWVSFDACRDADLPANFGELWGIYVASDFWESQVGWNLWLAASRRLRERNFAAAAVWVFAANSRAIRFYERQGFSRDESASEPITIGGREVQEIRMTTRLAD